MTLDIDATSFPSPNYAERPKGEVSAIVLHSGEGSKTSDLQRLLDDTVSEKSRVSAHFYVDRLANVYQLVDPSKEAYHAGVSSFLGRDSWNAFSIGIETEHRKGQVWPTAQRKSIEELCRELIPHYAIKEPWIVAHRWIAPTRRSDPSDWPNDELRMWIHGLYVSPTHELPGYVGPMICGQGFYDFYNTRGGFQLFGYALTPEAADIDSLGRECTWMRFERAVFKYVYGEGVHMCLLVEAINKRWAL